jgi:abequosyltransferase
METTLDILIPTYNREKDLVGNLSLLINYIRKLRVSQSVRIVVSDNGSTDSTVNAVEGLIANNPDVRIVLLEESSNKGLLHNIIKVLRYCSSQYVMYVGDDDFLSCSYFDSVMQIISSSSAAFILPARTIINPDVPLKEQLHKLNPKDVEFIKINFFNRIYLASQCNQLTGIVFRNNDLIGRWRKSGSFNLYPFMSFAGWSLTPSTTAVRIRGAEILITATNSKDWGYGSTGLLPDIIDNAKSLTENNFKRTIAEICFAFIWRDRIGMYLINVNKKSFHFLKEIFLEKRVLLLTKLTISTIFIFLFFKFSLYKIFGRLKSPHVIE